MSGIYIHIPFCKSKCGYCGFYSVPSLKYKSAFLDSLRQEVALRKDYLHGETVSTVYLGGGTPSILSVEEIGGILQWVKTAFVVTPDAEITLEANPDTLSPSYLQALRSMGVNRLSIGIQSFFDKDLNYLGRRHNAQHARQCLHWAKEAGFDNISIDLIYGLPTSNAERWNRNLDLFFELQLPHLSAYALTLEPNAILTKQIEKGMAQPVNEDDAVRDYGVLCKIMAQYGYEHYEISNFCKPGAYSRHNSNYWFGVPYVGFGPSAHSYDGSSRQWNVVSLDRYLECFASPHPVRDAPLIEKESLTPEQIYNEYVMLRLRTMWGIDLDALRRQLGDAFADHCERQARPLVQQGRLSRRQDLLFLNDEQMLFADGIAEALFW